MAQISQFSSPGGGKSPVAKPLIIKAQPGDGRALAALLAALLILATILLIALYGYASGAAWPGLWDYTYDAAGAVTSARFQTFWNWLELLIVPVVLLLGGALLGRYLESRRERVTWSTKVAEEYLKRFDDHAAVLHILALEEKCLSADQKLAVLRFGNWLEFVAALYARDLVDRDLFYALGLQGIICEFQTATAPYAFVAQARTQDWTHIIALSGR